MNTTRKESDALGFKEIPVDCLYGIHTARALENFPISGRKLPTIFIRAFATVKKACAMANRDTKYLSSEHSKAIISACDALIAGKHHESIVVDALQGGAGTSTNMNMNEVIANLAILKLGGKPGDYHLLHPLNHVNLHQSTNDVYPAALHIAVLFALKELEATVSNYQDLLQKKEDEWRHFIRLGRTELQDAVPMTLGMTASAWAEAASRDRWRIFKARERIKQHHLGGTAIGTGLGAPREYIFKATEYLRQLTGLSLARAENMVDATQNLDAITEVSAMLKSAAVNLMKIANDIRLLSSGPNGGFAELSLAPLQAGSSIMPGKVNPVIPEAAVQVALKVMANDNLIAQAAAMGNLELNHLLPLITDSLLESLQLLIQIYPLMSEKVIRPLRASPQQMRRQLLESGVLATALVPHFSYESVEKWVKAAQKENMTIQAYLLKEKLLTADELDEFLSPKKMLKMGFTEDDRINNKKSDEENNSK
jgi:aspartate ammonia-lyase